MQANNDLTPYLQLDLNKVFTNCLRMAELATKHNVKLRPHLKTAKSDKVARLATTGHSGALTVSTIAEARYFAANGFSDLTYAVGIVPAKLNELHALKIRYDARVGIILDSLEMAEAVAKRAAELNAHFPVYIEIDTGAGRGGVQPNDPSLIKIGSAVAEASSLSLRGVLTHAGHSYLAKSKQELHKIAEAERDGAVTAANNLRARGIACLEVSIGSTPTVLNLTNFSGVTEIRPGVYTLFDVDQYALGVCELGDIACTVVASVIGHNRQSNTILVDAGALALSKDLSPSKFRTDVGYGLVGRLDVGSPEPGIYLSSLHQEHGLITPITGAAPFEKFPVGSRVKIYPNHVCLTAAPYSAYRVIDGAREIATWGKATEW